MKDFLSAIWGPLGPGWMGEIRALHPAGPIQGFFENLDEAIAMVEAKAPQMDVYFGVLPRTKRNGGGDSIIDTTSVLWADFDGKNGIGKSGAFHAMRQVGPEPHIIVDSGNGYHAYWLLNYGVPFEEARAVMKGFSVMVGADKTFDKARILRVPGTTNHKGCGGIGIHGMDCHPVRLVKYDVLDRRHRISDFVDYANASVPIRRPPREGDLERPANGWDPSTKDAPKFGPGERNNGLTRLAGIMFARGMQEDEVLVALEWENSMRCDPPLVDREVENIVRSVGRYAR